MNQFFTPHYHRCRIEINDLRPLLLIFSAISNRKKLLISIKSIKPSIVPAILSFIPDFPLIQRQFVQKNGINVFKYEHLFLFNEHFSIIDNTDSLAL